MNQMQCTTDCGAEGQFKYDGASRTCEDVCPNGYIADPSTDTCVHKCPSGWYFST